MQHAYCLAVPGGGKASDLGTFQAERLVFAPCYLGVGGAYHEQFLVVGQQAVFILHLLGGSLLDLVGRIVGASFRILYGIFVAPDHGKAPVGVGVGAASGTAHPELFSVVDEGRAGAEYIHVSSYLHEARSLWQVARGAVGVVVGDEGHYKGSAVLFLDSL